MIRNAALVCVLSVGFASSARAEDPPNSDHRTAWRGVVVGSLATIAIGGGLWIYGKGQVDDAEFQLCTGQHATDCGHVPPQDPAVVTKYNDQGWHGTTVTTIGGLTMGSAAIVGAVAFYKGFIEKDPGSRSTVVVAPIVTPTGGGATLRWQW